jgi:hypothetical protein
MNDHVALSVFLTVVFGGLALFTVALAAILVFLMRRNRRHSN